MISFLYRVYLCYYGRSYHGINWRGTERGHYHNNFFEANFSKHSMAWFIEQEMRFRFKVSDFDLFINILTILKFQNYRMSFTMTHMPQ